MSHEVVFLPHILGQTWAQALTAARTAAREEDPRIVAARLEPWPDLVLHAAEILGQIEEFRGRGQRELHHPVTRLRFTFFGEDGVIALPYWYDGPVARMAATMAYRFAHAVEADTGLAAYDPQQRTPLAEMGLEKFIAGYLRGRERALDQTQARGPVPVGHALPTGRGAGRRELVAGSSGGGDGARPGSDARPAADVRAGAESGRVPRAGKPVRGDAAAPRAGKPAREEAASGGTKAAARRPGAEERSAADSGPAVPGRLRRGGKPARGEQPQRSGRVAEPRKAARREEPADARRGEAAESRRSRSDAEPKAGRRGERADAERGQRRGEPGEPQRSRSDAARRGEPEQAQRPDKVARPRKPSRRERAEAERAQRARQERGVPPPPGAEWVPRPGQPEQWGVPAEPQRRVKRPDQPPPRGQGQGPRRGDLRRAGEPPEQRRAPQPGERPGGERPDGQDPMMRVRPPELPKGRF